MERKQYSWFFFWIEYLFLKYANFQLGPQYGPVPEMFQKISMLDKRWSNSDFGCIVNYFNGCLYRPFEAKKRPCSICSKLHSFLGFFFKHDFVFNLMTDTKRAEEFL